MHSYSVPHDHLYGDPKSLAHMKCNHKTFFSESILPADKCWIAMNNCDDSYDFVNFFAVNYCWLGGLIYIAIPLSFFLIFLIFKFISSVVEEYLAPAIAYLSEWLKLPEALAAVTLLALANGAGDVITALVASGAEGGLAYNIGSIYGAGLFVTSCVIAATIFSSPKDIQLEANSIYRDIGIYIIATSTVIVFGFIGELSVVSASIMLVEYLCLVIIVCLQEFVFKKSEGNKELSKEEEKLDKQEEQIETPEQKKEKKKERLEQKGLVFFDDDKTEEEKNAKTKKWTQTLPNISTTSGNKKKNLITKNFRALIYLAMKHDLKNKEKETEFSELSAMDKVFYIINFPFDYMRKFTLPPCEPEKYEKIWAVIFPIPGIAFMIWIVCFPIPPIWILAAIPIGGIISLAIHFTSEDAKAPNYYPALELFGTIGALMWTYLVSGILIDLLQFLGMLSKLNSTYLGLTVIAVGNALPDGVTTIALAKQGYAMMGMTGAYAGQLFGLLVGFGLALLKITMTKGTQDFKLFSPDQFSVNAMNIMVIVVSLFNLVLTFFYGISTHYKFKKSLAYIIGTLYVLFFLVATGIAVVQAMSS